MAKCRYDCFHCIYADCIIEKMSSKERREIKKRDERYEYCSNGRSVVPSRTLKQRSLGR